MTLIESAVNQYRDYIASQTLALSVSLVDTAVLSEAQSVEIDENVMTYVRVSKI